MKGTAALSPTQNVMCERKGGSWKIHAKALIDECSISFNSDHKKTWLCVAVSWAVNNAINESGYSPSQWVLGRGIRLPYDMLTPGAKLSLHCKHTTDKSFSERIAMIAAAQRSTAALRYSKSLSHAITARSRGDKALPVQARFQLGDQVFYWRGLGKGGKTKSEWASVWHGPAIIIGFERNNLWVQHRNTAVKCQANHVRHAQMEEQVPWKQILSEVSGDSTTADTRGTDERLPPNMHSGAGSQRAQHTYLDMTSPGEEAPPAKKQRGQDSAPASTSPGDFWNAEREPPMPPPPEPPAPQEFQIGTPDSEHEDVDLDKDLQDIFGDEPIPSDPAVSPEDEAAWAAVPDDEVPPEPNEQPAGAHKKKGLRQPDDVPMSIKTHLKTKQRLRQPNDLPMSIAQKLKARQQPGESTAVAAKQVLPPKGGEPGTKRSKSMPPPQREKSGSSSF